MPLHVITNYSIITNLKFVKSKNDDGVIDHCSVADVAGGGGVSGCEGDVMDDIVDGEEWW